MFIKFNFRKSLFYLAIYRIIYYVRLTILMLMKSKTDFDDPTNWPSQFDWIIDTLLKMKQAFKKYI